eukprot:scaffold30514_cov154-Skeletonema_dohrnii-CCMP3373.AAC.2
MVSRKKAKGKARRAAKAEKAKAIEVKDEVDEVAANYNQSRMGQLQMNDDAQKSDNTRTRTASPKCHHGLVPSHRRQSHEEFMDTSNNVENCKGFLKRFVHEFDSAAGNFLEAYHATKETYGEVWNDPGKMKFVVSYLITCGTSKVLEGHPKIASKYAALASYFEQYMEVDFLNTRPYPNWPKIRELYISSSAADEHTLVSFLKKRIPCCCLDEKYKQVKSISKIGICFNPKCPLPGGITKRSATKCCSRCRWAVNYCSEECQEAAWPEHKADCDFYVHCFNADLEARLESELRP